MAHKGVIVAAGYGTRFLPITRTVPKELLPIVARPALDLVVEEFVEAGITDILVITSRRKRAVDDWFDRDPELEAAVASRPGRAALATPPEVRTTLVRQQRMTGTGDAILLARAFAGGDPIVVAFPDDLFGAPNPTRALLDAHEATGSAVLATVDLGDADVSRYGVIDATHEAGGVLRVRGIVEKPAPGTEPSKRISVGRYLYTPTLLDLLAEHRARHTGGEYPPMPAMNDLAARGGLVAVEVDAPRWDTGHPLGYLTCVVDHALAHPELGEPFAAMLRDRLGVSR